MAKVKNTKAGGFLGGFVILIIGILILWNNEGRTVKMQSAINEATKNYTDVESTSIDSKYEGKIIATTGKIDLSESDQLQDQKFGIRVTGAKLERMVEMYQWQEECTTDENDKTNCTYSKDWSNSLIDSSEFKQGGHQNPTSFKFEGEDFLASNVKVGAFEMPQRLLEKLSYNKDLKNEQLTEQYKNTVEGFKVVDNYITNTVNSEDAQIGDLRVSYKVATDGEVSMLGVQKGKTLTAFTGKKGKSIFEIKRGSHTGAEILTGLTNSNKMIKWVLRVVGVLLVCGGISSLFTPLTMLADKVPVLGKIVGMSTSLISTVLGLSISLVVIAIAWFRFRPILSIVLLAVVIGLLVFLKFQKGKKPIVESKDVESKKEEK